MKQSTERAPGSAGMYATGFILSLLFTLGTYVFTYIHVHSQHETFSHRMLIPTIFAFAIAQLFVQLVFFLHLGRGSNTRWNMLMLIFGIGVVIIVVGGSIWIMDNLNYNMMRSPTEMNKYLNSQGNL